MAQNRLRPGEIRIEIEVAAEGEHEVDVAAHIAPLRDPVALRAGDAVGDPLFDPVFSQLLAASGKEPADMESDPLGEAPGGILLENGQLLISEDAHCQFPVPIATESNTSRNDAPRAAGRRPCTIRGVRIRLNDGSREIELVGRSHLVELYSQEMAVAYFRRLLRDPANRTALRRALADETSGSAFRMDDEEVLKELARRVVYGDLRVLVRNAFPSGGNAAPPDASQSTTPLQDEQAAREESPAAAPASAAQAAAEPEETDPLVAAVDPAAQAQSLQAAADSGAPLCEL